MRPAPTPWAGRLHAALMAGALAGWLPAGAAAQAPSPSPGAVSGAISNAGIATGEARMVPLMGKRLFTPQGDELGRVVDVVFDSALRPVAAVVDVGGFLGVGARRVALAWEMLALVAHEESPRVVTETAPARIGAAPDYRPGDPASILTPDPPR